MKEKETYTMEAKCRNCGTRIHVEIPKGTNVGGAEPYCPYCGRTGGEGFNYIKPSGKC